MNCFLRQDCGWPRVDGVVATVRHKIEGQSALNAMKIISEDHTVL